MNRRIFLTLSVLVVFFTGCKKKGAEATCTDGIHNGIETGVDCGGNCTACVQTVPSYANFYIDGKYVSIADRSISHQTSYYQLILLNDSIQLKLNIGNGTANAGAISQTGSLLIYNNHNYPDLNHGQYILSSIDTVAHTMSGYFNAVFGYAADSVQIAAGQFNKIPY